MAAPKCLITGCALVDSAQGRWLWGDLHIVGEALAFNGVTDHKGEAAWQHSSVPNVRKAVFISGSAYFERRGVVAFCSKQSTFNEAARLHLESRPK